VPAQPEVGSSASSYEILAKLATGGMAEIFLARGASTAGIERYVVLKRILRDRASDAAFVRMFLDEAKLASQLQHPNIAQVYDIGKLGDSFFFTMEYVHGETVRTLLHRSHALRKPIPLGAVLSVAVGAAAGLHHAHERNGMDGMPLGIVHRDVSPSNLMISYEGAVKLVDFGVAKAAHNRQDTRSGTVKGKISYLSPEQCHGRSIDRRSDLFSLGIVLWEMLTTERLFRQSTDFETMAAIVNEPSPPPSSRRPDLPPALDAVVGRLLAKDPAARYQTGAELLEHVEQLAVQLGIALSTALFGRMMRELFGQRPEPWIELRSNQEHAQVITVTGEPLPESFEQMPVATARPTLDMPRAAMTVPVIPVTPMAPFAASGSNPFSQSGVLVSPPTSVPQPPSPQPSPLPRRWGSRLVLVLVPAALVGVILAFGFGSRKHRPAPGTSLVTPTIDAPLPAVPAVIAATKDIDAAVPAVIAATKDIDAAIPIDAAVPHTVDAAVAIAAVPIDAAAPPPVDADVPPAVATADEHHVVEHHVVKHHVAQATDIAEMKPAAAVAACTGSAAVLAANQITCAISACRAKDMAHAKKWLAAMPASKRTAVITACPALAPNDENSDECKRDPLACY
jgi:serine/threonine protein kinase